MTKTADARQHDKFVDSRPNVDPNASARKLIEIGRSVTNGNQL
jgi:hypothetical protein